MRAVIVDDELKGRQLLATMLQKFCPDVEVLALAGSVPDGIDAIRVNKPDLVFLDVEMPPSNGFELLEQMGPFEFKVIFVTAHDHYAMKAIKFSALDYLLKPIDVTELKKAVAKALESGPPVSERPQYEALLQNLKTKQDRIGLPTRNGLVFVHINDIVRFQADSNYTRIFIANGDKFIAARTLKEFDQMLSDSGFIRTHQSHLVNLIHVKEYVRGDGGTLVLSDKSRVEVSRRHKDGVLTRLGHL